MKNKKISIILLALLLIFPLINAQLEGIENSLDNIEDIKEDIEDDPKEYLKKEWSKFFEKSAIGKTMQKISDILQPLNPFFEIIFGMKFMWSWLFLLNTILWICLLIFTYRFLSFIEILSKTARFIISILAIILISVLQITPLISNAIVNQITKIPNLLTQIISVIMIILLLVTAIMYSKLIEQIAKKTAKEKKKIKTRKIAKKALRTAERAEKTAKEAKEQKNNQLTDILLDEF